MPVVKRESCGASNCKFNEKFRCTLNEIHTDNTSKCTSIIDRDER